MGMKCVMTIFLVSRFVENKTLFLPSSKCVVVSRKTFQIIKEVIHTDLIKSCIE